MNYIYFGLSDLYLPTAAAAVHLGQLDPRKKPTRKELSALPLIRTARRGDPGILHPAGTDKSGNHVYITWINAQPDVVVRAVSSLLSICGRPRGEVKAIPCVLENQQIGWLCSFFCALHLNGISDRLGFRVIHNRFTDLAHLSPTHP